MKSLQEISPIFDTNRAQILAKPVSFLISLTGLKRLWHWQGLSEARRTFRARKVRAYILKYPIKAQAWSKTPRTARSLKKLEPVWALFLISGKKVPCAKNYDECEEIVKIQSRLHFDKKSPVLIKTNVLPIWKKETLSEFHFSCHDLWQKVLLWDMTKQVVIWSHAIRTPIKRFNCQLSIFSWPDCFWDCHIQWKFSSVECFFLWPNPCKQ